MKICKNNNDGFTITAVMWLVLILIIIAGVAWYVLAKNKDSQPVAQTAAQTNSTTTQNQPATKYFEFKEYSVRIIQPDSLAKLTYQAKQIDTDSGKTTSLFLNDADLAKAIDNCNTTKGSSGNFAAITKTSGNYPAEPTPDTGGLLKQFDTFYISSSYPNGIPCEDDSKEDAVVAQMKTLQKALVEAFKTAEKY